jgi:hypothetical protein
MIAYDFDPEEYPRSHEKDIKEGLGDRLGPNEMEPAGKLMAYR